MQLFNIYFLLLTIVSAVVVLVFDIKYFRSNDERAAVISAQFWAISYIVLASVLFLINVLL